MLTVQDLVDDNVDDISFKWVAGQSAANRLIPDNGMAAADLIGHLNLIHPSRIQVFGREEMAYYLRFDSRRRVHHLEELLAGGVPAILLADNLEATDDLILNCENSHVPLLSSSIHAADLIDLLRIYLSRRLAPTTTVHGVFMDVLGLGVLITGESGLGKSELALELITRGHGLVADDVVDFARIAPDTVEGKCPPLLQNLLEVRGLGLLDIKAIFGETSVRRRLRLRLMVQLVRRSAIDEYERLPLEALTEEVLGLPIRKVVIPVAAGRNLAVLVEAAVRNTVLQLRGVDTVKEFTKRQQAAMRQGV